MKILGVTLARAGSKGVVGKNIRELAGAPLISYTVSEALRSSLITDYVVSTESREIANLVNSLGAETPFLRPIELARDESTSVDALHHAIQFMESKNKCKYDYVIELMATNPFKTAADIDRSLNLLIDTGADSVIAVNRVLDGHPTRIKKLVDGRIRDFCLPEPQEGRRQDLRPDAFIRCGAIYALKRDEIMVNRRRYGSVFSLPIELDFNNSVNIDTENDFYLASFLMEKKLGKY